jgi:lambda repressor-like predicted transcriptional regulator/predicted GIY-YIG superfamily endonuclease
MTPTTLTPATHWVYRYFDKDDRLLYVGATSDLFRRDAGHRHASHWIKQAVRREATEYADAAGALAAEGRAIRDESPLHNIQQSHSIEYPQTLAGTAVARITAAMREQGVSLAALCIATGLKPNTIGRILRTGEGLDVDQLFVVAAHLALDPADLIAEAAA